MTSGINLVEPRVLVSGCEDCSFIVVWEILLEKKTRWQFYWREGAKTIQL